jgi:hypothetical protein
MPDVLATIVVGLAIITYLWFWARVFYKAGYSYFLLMALGMCVPLLNLGLMLWLVIAEWPVQRELRVANERARAGLP